jgi:hypothetical protein
MLVAASPTSAPNRAAARRLRHRGRARRGATRAALAIALVFAPATTGCLAPVLHPVDIAGPGHMLAAISGQFVGTVLQGEAQLAVGIAPHLQLEGAGALGLAGVASAGGGARVQVPLTPAWPNGIARVSLQIAALYEHDALPTYTGCGKVIFGLCYSGGQTDGGSLELGVVWHPDPHPRGAAIGFWLSGGPTFIAPPASFDQSTPFVQGALRISGEVPIDDRRHFNVLAGGTIAYAAVSDLQPTRLQIGAGVGIVMRY